MSKKSLQELAEEARKRRLDGPHHNNNEFPLVGYCFDNAYVMYTLLKENGLNPTIVVGTTERVAEDLLNNDIDLEDDITNIQDLAGLVHYWIECNNKIIDIASDTYNNLGQIIVTNKLPENYYKYSDSMEYAQEVLDSARVRRCSYCGAQIKECEHK